MPKEKEKLKQTTGKVLYYGTVVYDAMLQVLNNISMKVTDNKENCANINAFPILLLSLYPRRWKGIQNKLYNLTHQ